MYTFYYKPQEKGKALGAPGFAIKGIRGAPPEGAHFEAIFDIDPVETVNDAFGGVWPTKKACHRYRGPLLIDMDINVAKGLKTLTDVWAKTNETLLRLTQLGAAYIVFFSGSKGYHIEVPSTVFFKDPTAFHLGLPLAYKGLVQELGIPADMSRYSKGYGPSIRLPNVNRLMADGGMGPVKIQLTSAEFAQGPGYHTQICWAPRPLWKVEALYSEALASMLANHLGHVGLDVEAPNLVVDFTALRGATPDCIKRISKGQGEDTYHTRAFKIATWAVSANTDVPSDIMASMAALSSTAYTASADRLEHIRHQLEDVRRNAYTFSCGAMRAAVKPDCACCPLRQFLPYEVKSPESPFRGVLLKGGDLFLLGEDDTLRLIGPSMHVMGRGVDDKGVTGKLRVKVTDKEGLVAMEDLFSPISFSKQASKVAQGPVAYSFTGQTLAGVLHMLSISAASAEIFREVPSAGLYIFRGERYWADHTDGGITINSRRELSANVVMNTNLRDQITPTVKLVGRKPRPLPVELVEIIQKVHAPEFIYPILCWVAATMFKERLPKPWPILFIAGQAGTGKSSIVASLCKPLAGYADGEPVQAQGMTNYVLRGLAASYTGPVFLDEVKCSLLRDNPTGTGGLGPAQLNGLVRAGWDGALYIRGNHGGENDSFPFSAGLCMIGPYVPDVMDSASLERLVSVTGDPSKTSAHSADWNQFYAYPGREEHLLDFAALLMNCALLWPDEVVHTLYTEAVARVTALGLKDRPRESAIRLQFGNGLLARLAPAWRLNACAQVLNVLAGDQVDIAHMYADDEFSQLLVAILRLADPANTAVAAWVRIGPTTLLFENGLLWVELNDALQKVSVSKQGPTGINVAAFIKMAKTKGLFSQHLKLLVVNGRKLSGAWVGLAASKLQNDYDLRTIPGFQWN